MDTIDPSWTIDGLSFKTHNVQISSIRTTLVNGYISIKDDTIIPMEVSGQVNSNSMFVVTEDENQYGEIRCDDFGCTMTDEMRQRMFDQIGMPVVEGEYKV